MPLRLARYSDLPEISKVLAAAFHDEELHVHLFPYRKEFPQDYQAAWSQAIEEKYWDYSNIFIVRCIDGKIDGVSIWTRNGQGAETLWGTYGKFDPRHWILPIIATKNSWYRYLIPNRAERKATPDDPEPIRKWNFGPTIGPFISHLFTEPAERRTHWELEMLGIRPDMQGHGVGRELVEWGLNRAKQDNLPVVVVAAPEVEGFYQKCGFSVPGGSASQEDQVVRETDADGKVVERVIINPLKKRGIGGGAIFWTR